MTSAAKQTQADDRVATEDRPGLQGAAQWGVVAQHSEAERERPAWGFANHGTHMLPREGRQPDRLMHWPCGSLAVCPFDIARLLSDDLHEARTPCLIYSALLYRGRRCPGHVGHNVDGDASCELSRFVPALGPSINTGVLSTSRLRMVATAA